MTAAARPGRALNGGYRAASAGNSLRAIAAASRVTGQFGRLQGTARERFGAHVSAPDVGDQTGSGAQPAQSRSAPL